MDRKKIGILVVIGIFLVGITLFALVLANNENTNNPNSPNSPSNPSNPSIPIDPNTPTYDYVIIDNTDMWRFNNNSFRRINDYIENDDLYNVYINNNYYGEYNLKYGTTWNLFKNNQFTSYDGNLFAFSKGININVKNKEINNITSTEKDEIRSLLNNNIIDFDNLSVNEMMMVDLDSNGETDKIVSISNINIESLNSYFNLVYVVLNGEVSTLINTSIKPEDMLNAPMYNLNYVININNDYYDSIILKVRYFSVSETAHNILFQYQNNRFVKKFD